MQDFTGASFFTFFEGDVGLTVYRFPGIVVPADGVPRMKDCTVEEWGIYLRGPNIWKLQFTVYWVAAQELKVSFYNMETLFFTISPYYFLSSNPDIQAVGGMASRFQVATRSDRLRSAQRTCQMQRLATMEPSKTGLLLRKLKLRYHTMGM